MRCSLFGKLVARRDFIALSAPRDFLTAWEPWMQGCVSASRETLGEAWQQAYLNAPIWRFWLGRDICGATVAGALMSSLDGLGRYYPLTLFAYADPGNAIAPPDVNAHDDWFATAENFLLSTLDKGITYEAITHALDQLLGPGLQSTDVPLEELSILKTGIVSAWLGSRSFSDLFAVLRTANYPNVYAAASFWWTIGGGNYQPLGFCCRGMPEPIVFTAMLTGRINSSIT